MAFTLASATRDLNTGRHPRRVRLLAALVVLALTPLPGLAAGDVIVLRPVVEVLAAAVAETSDGLVGSLANVSITVADGGNGHVFIDTYPLTQVDMQGSARLAVKVAGAVSGVDTSRVDVFFVVRSGSSVIGGPSAGGILAVGAVAALANLTVDPTVLMTGTVNPDGTIGPVGGIPQKAAAAAEANARVFLIPEGQEVVRERRGDEVVEVNMTRYCAEELRILCREVVDVEEAVLLVTGHDFRRPPPTGEVQGDDFRAILRPKAETLLRQAEADVEAARSRYDEAAIDLPEGVRTPVGAETKVAEDALAAARGALAAGEYYTAASKAFQAAIAARDVNWTLAYIEAEDTGAFLAEIRGATRDHVDAVAFAAHRADWSTLGRVDGIGSAQMKAREAQGLADAADAQLALVAAGAGDQAVPAIYNLAYAWERADTVPFWLDIASDTPAGPPVEAAAVAGLANDVAGAAEEGLAYAQTILSEIGGGPVNQLQRAAFLLNLSRTDLAAGNVPGALLQAIEADVRAGLALTTAGYTEGIPRSLVDAARARAARAIADAREQGLEPVLAVSYYEFAPAAGDSVNELLYYQQANAAAHLQELLAGVDRAPTTSRFVGEGRLPDLWVPKEYLLAFFALGCAVGASAAVGAAVLSKREAMLETTRAPRTPPAFEPVLDAPTSRSPPAPPPPPTPSAAGPAAPALAPPAAPLPPPPATPPEGPRDP